MPDQIQELEYGFHSAACQMLVDVATGLYSLANQLIKEVCLMLQIVTACLLRVILLTTI